MFMCRANVLAYEQGVRFGGEDYGIKARSCEGQFREEVGSRHRGQGRSGSGGLGESG